MDVPWQAHHSRQVANFRVTAEVRGERLLTTWELGERAIGYAPIGVPTVWAALHHDVGRCFRSKHRLERCPVEI